MVNSDDSDGPSVPHNTRDTLPGSGMKTERAVGKTIDQQYRRLLLPPDQPLDSKILRMAIIGAPNSGKSTLSNQLMGWRVTSVSSKVHTTRKNTLAVLTEGKHQIVFIDTPGIVHPKERSRHNLEKSLVRDPEKSLETADLVGVIVDVSNKWTSSRLSHEILRALYLYPHTPTILILNKVDNLKSKEMLLQLTRSLTEGVVDEKQIYVTSNNFFNPKKRVNLESLFDKHDARTMEHYRNRFGQNTANKGMREKSIESFESDIDRTVLNVLPYDSEYTEDGVENNDAHEHEEIHNNRDFVDENMNVSARYGQRLSGGSTAGYPDKINENHNSLNPPFPRKPLEDIGSLDKSQRLSANSTGGYPDEMNEIPNYLKPTFPRRPLEDKGSLDKSQKLKLKRRQFVNNLITGKKGWSHFRRVFMVSARDGDGVADLKEYLLECCHPGDWEYHSSMVTDQDPQELALMYVREKLLNYLPQEIPYQISPEIVIWDVDEDGVLNVVMNIHTYNQRHTRFVIGQKGQTIQRISEEAKQDMMNTFRCEMRLKLQVKQRH